MDFFCHINRLIINFHPYSLQSMNLILLFNGLIPCFNNQKILSACIIFEARMTSNHQYNDMTTKTCKENGRKIVRDATFIDFVSTNEFYIYLFESIKKYEFSIKSKLLTTSISKHYNIETFDNYLMRNFNNIQPILSIDSSRHCLAIVNRWTKNWPRTN